MIQAAVRRAPAVLIVVPALFLGACASGGSPGTTTGRGAGGGGLSAPAQDTFVGTIVSGTGAHSRTHGAVTLYLHPHGAGRSRSVEVFLQGGCPGSPAGCSNLDGSFTGSLTQAGRRIPDVGSQYTLSGHGRVIPLGEVSARGVVQGTGFIERGHELMRLTLATASGSVTVSARTARLPGFRSP